MKKQQLILGIDDAGRGPVVGSMALAGCLVTKELEKEFKKIGVKDSKMLAPKTREHLAEIIREKAISHYVTLTSASEIDSSLNSGTNLNKIEAIKSAKIINKLTKDIKEQVKVIIDCPSPNRERWKGFVMEHVNNPENLIVSCEHKADVNHPSVSAASILAKSEREKNIAEIKKQIGEDFGSGYPNDPKTKDFLEKFGKKYKDKGIFRQTWATFKEHESKKTQKKLGEF